MAVSPLTHFSLFIESRAYHRDVGFLGTPILVFQETGCAYRCQFYWFFHLRCSSPYSSRANFASILAPECRHRHMAVSIRHCCVKMSARCRASALFLHQIKTSDGGETEKVEIIIKMMLVHKQAHSLISPAAGSTGRFMRLFADAMRKCHGRTLANC